MKKIFFAASSLIISLTILVAYAPKSITINDSLQYYHINGQPQRLIDISPNYFNTSLEPNEQRGEQFRPWLSVSVKIATLTGMGSGSIVYYDSETGYAYVQSCGHLWTGTSTAEDIRRFPLPILRGCSIIVWYHNEQKLSQTEKYAAEILFYSNDRGHDCSLLRFKPSWVPRYFPIASSDFQYTVGTRFHSLGCDGGNEVAHYDVRCLGPRGVDIMTTENSPRKGRSGGGLFTDNNFVGVCWGTDDENGDGNGFFTPLKAIIELNQKNGFGWLNEVGKNWAREIPIIDRNSPQGKYDKNYIPLPQDK